MSPWRRFAPAAQVARRDLALFTRSLARLLLAGLPLADAVRLAAQAPGGALSLLADDLCTEIRSGVSLSLALQRHDSGPRPVFGAVYRGLVQAAEAGGVLGQSLGRLADYTDKSEQLSQSVRSALVYPALLLSATLISLIILVVFVTPRFEGLFAGLGQEIPLLTRMIIGGASLARSYGWILVLAGGACIIYVWRKWREPDFRADLDARLLRLPQAGDILRKIVLERVARGLSALIQNGVVLTEALVLSASIAGNRPFNDALMQAAEKVREGQSLFLALGQHKGLFSELMLQLVRIGEESSALDKMLAHFADITAMEVEARTGRLIALLEPMLVLLIGVVMAVVIIGLIGAITGINDLVVR